MIHVQLTRSEAIAICTKKKRRLKLQKLLALRAKRAIKQAIKRSANDTV